MNSVQGIQKRWMANSLSTVLILVGIAVAAITMVMASYYYTYLESSLMAKAKSTSLMIANNGYQTETAYREFARQYVEGFEDRDRLALQFLTAGGKVFLSSQGSGSTPGLADFSLSTPDVKSALQGTVDPWSGSDPQTNERVMAVSVPLIYDGAVRGVVRYVTSLSAVNGQIVLTGLVTLAAGLILFLVVAVSNLYFLKSIIEPVAKITETAKRIAAGSYGVQIEKQRYNDEIGALADTINDMSLKISQSEKMKSEFISSVSHELRTPLTAIKGWGETLRDADAGDKELIQKGMQVIIGETERLSSMVEDLLDFSRMQTGRLSLIMSRMDLVAELSEAVLMFTERAKREGLSLLYDEPEIFLTVIGDKNRLRQVFVNILDNALKYSDSGDTVEVTAKAQGDFAVITIADTGIGISKEDLPNVKAKFFKANSTRRGSGIGLAVADEIINLHGGKLTLDSVEGKGTTVTIQIPLSVNGE